MSSSKRTCKIRILNEVECVLVGLHPDHIAYFYEEYGVHAANYFFNPKFKLGSWDGKIRYFHKTGKTYVNLLEEIIPRVMGLGYKISLDDDRKGKPVSPDLIDKDFLSHVIMDSGEHWEMRPYQVDMVNALISNGGGIGIAGTGGGKTSMTAALALAYEKTANFRSIIIVPDKSLTVQTRNEYAFFGLDVGEYSGDRKDYKHQHVVSTWQSLKNNPKVIQDFDVIIVDECHGLRGNVLTKLLNEHGKDIPYRFGVTGTLPKDPSDALAVRVAVGNVQYTIEAHQLIDEGFLAKPHIDIVQHTIDLTKQYEEELRYWDRTEKPPTYQQFKDSYYPDWTSEKSALQGEKKRLEWIAREIRKKKDQGKGNVLCLVNGVRVGKRLSEMVEGSYFVHGKDKTKVRKEIYDMFKENNDHVVIATVHIASTGLDIPRIFHLVFIDIGKSFIRVIQSIGRGLRKAHDKDTVIITDICSDLKYSRRHLRERSKYYRDAKYPFKKHLVDFEKDLDDNDAI